MPRRYTRKRKYRRRRKTYIGRAMPGFPSNKIVKMRYVDRQVLNPGVSTIGGWVYRANSIHDPDFSGLGHQPLGHDQWEQYYNHYVVLGSKINVKFMYDATNANTGQAVGVYLSDDQTYPSDVDNLMEQGLGKYRVMAAVNYDPNCPSITNKFSAKKYFNVKDVKDNVTRIGATFGANPTDMANYIVWASALNPTVDLGDTWILTTIDYIVALSEPKALPKST